MATTRLLTVVDTPARLELRAPRAGLAIVALGLLLVAGAIGLATTDHRLAQGVLAAVALAVGAGMLHVHELVLDVERRAWRWRRGWLPWPTVRSGTFDDLAEVAVEASSGLMASETVSRLRSRVVVLRFGRWPEGLVDDGAFQLGFPMGPRAAEGESERYAARLGVPVVDRTDPDLDDPDLDDPDLDDPDLDDPDLDDPDLDDPDLTSPTSPARP